MSLMSRNTATRNHFSSSTRKRRTGAYTVTTPRDAGAAETAPRTVDETREAPFGKLQFGSEPLALENVKAYKPIFHM